MGEGGGVKAAAVKSLQAELGLSGISGISGRDRGVGRPKDTPMASGPKPQFSMSQVMADSNYGYHKWGLILTAAPLSG